MPIGKIQRLFRKRQVRLLEGNISSLAPDVAVKTRRVSKDTLLDAGAQLLIPKTVAADTLEQTAKVTGNLALHLCSWSTLHLVSLKAMLCS